VFGLADTANEVDDFLQSSNLTYIYLVANCAIRFLAHEYCAKGKAIRYELSAKLGPTDQMTKHFRGLCITLVCCSLRADLDFMSLTLPSGATGAMSTTA
jgi:hypothetical protein